VDNRGGTGRVYRGLSQEQRRAERRGRLLAAGLELFGTDGWYGTSIERLCARAQVSTRYFYEEFHSRENLMELVFATEFGRAADVAMAALTSSTALETFDPPAELRRRLEVTARTYVHHVTADPRRLRVIHKESRAVPAFEPVRQDTVERVAARLWAHWFTGSIAAPPRRASVRRSAVHGAMSEVLLDWWTAPEPRPPVPPLADALAALFVVSLAPTPT
jgi:AcrR family transcriptional regulator